MSTAILVIDLINEFVTGRLGDPRAEAVVKVVKKVLDVARSKGFHIVYITDSHLPDDKEYELWGKHAKAGTFEAMIVPELEPKESDFHLYKRRYSAFYGTGLDPLLRDLCVENVVLTGVLTNICIQHTATDAYYRNYKVIVPRDCVDALSDKEQTKSLEFMKRMYGIEETNSEKLLDSWRNSV